MLGCRPQVIIRWLTTWALALNACGQAAESVVAPTGISDVAPDVPQEASGAVDTSSVDSATVGPDPSIREPEVPVGGFDQAVGPGISALPYSCQTDEQCTTLCGGQGRCEDNACVYEEQGQCYITEQGADRVLCGDVGAASPYNPCMACLPHIAVERFTGLFLKGDFQGTLEPFAQLDDANDANVRWHVTHERAVIGDQSLRFGRPDEPTYEGYGRVFGRALTTRSPMPASLQGTLWFWLWLETEQTPGYDVLSIRTLVDGVETVVWDSDLIGGTTHGVWQRIEVPLSFEGHESSGQLVFQFDSVDGIIDFFEGVYIDHLTLTTRCCGIDEDCRDSDPCTVDQCGEDGRCVHTAIDGCCHTRADCFEGGICDFASCARPGQSCVYTPIPGCCAEDIDCDDGIACTLDECIPEEAMCLHAQLCCSYDGDCQHDVPCLIGSCTGGECTYEDRCCGSDEACQDEDPCTVDICNQGVCEHLINVEGACCQEVLYHEDFNQGAPVNWTINEPVGGVGWWITDAFDDVPSPPGALYYGNPVAGNFDTGSVNLGSVSSAVIVLPHGVQLSMKLSAFLELEPFSGVDSFRVTILGPGGENTIFDKSDFDLGVWTTNESDISSYAGHEIRIKFYFNSVTEEANTGLGVLLDDLRITTSCEVPTCDVDADCAGQDDCILGLCDTGNCHYEDICCLNDLDCYDDDPCTVGSCDSGVCARLETPGCCTEPSDCVTDDVCTFGLCQLDTQSCVYQPITGCCTSASSCEDGDPCTLDQCLDNICTSKPQCCAADDDCQDDEPICTVDSCVDGLCQHAPSGLEGCCTSTPVEWHFEDDVSFSMTATAPPCQWQIVEAPQTFSGTSVLYYGNTSEWDYNCGHNAGVATSPSVSLAPSFGYTLSFALFLDGEDNAVFDLLDLTAMVDGQPVLLWDKKSVAAVSNWYVYTIDISALAGRTFELRFSFDSVDEVGNQGSGFYIDALTIASSCMPVHCVDDASCDDSLPDTEETCAFDGCRYTIE